jgi:hypothetical protein
MFQTKGRSTKAADGSVTYCKKKILTAILNTGIDYSGQFEIKCGNVRSKTTTIYYVTLFTCMATKATHLELVPNLIS